MINSTSTDEAHWTLLKQIYKHPQLVRNTTVFFGPRTENVSSPAQQQGTPVLPTTT
jgi:hypothetical protein